jgi:class 3 adenylate cyclase
MGGKMVALLFADVAGFSKLTEDEIPLFVRHFLQPVGDLARHSPHKPVQKNTWGDGLYFVFENVKDAGLFALELRDLVARTKWKDKGFKNELGLRTGLHVGPVYACRNPVTEQPDHIGTHVSRAARIEPITPRGQVYASEVFAAIAFAVGASGFQCEYVGRMGMAKGYGIFPTYHVRRVARTGQAG